MIIFRELDQVDGKSLASAGFEQELAMQNNHGHEHRINQKRKILDGLNHGVLGSSMLVSYVCLACGRAEVASRGWCETCSELSLLPMAMSVLGRIMLQPLVNHTSI